MAEESQGAPAPSETPQEAGQTTQGAAQTPQGTGGAPAGEPPADALVIFGITGDLAKVMTFRSLYRLERRGLLGCPIVGVAVEDWSVEHLRAHARECIEGTGEVGRRCGARATLRGAAFVRERGLQGGRHLRAGARGGGRGAHAGLLPGDSRPPCSGR